MKQIVGANLRALVGHHDADLAAACNRLGMKLTQVKRVMAGKHAVTMRTVERIAVAYDLDAYQLLVPGLDPANPQILRSLGPAEAKLYQAFREALDAEQKAGTQ